MRNRAYFEMSCHTEGGIDYFLLVGELDVHHRDEVFSALVARAHQPTVIVAVAELTFIDSAGVSALLQAQREFQGQGNRLQVWGARGAVRKTFEC